MPPFNNLPRLGAAMLLAGALSGCSEYLERRDGLSVQAGNAVETDKVAQMIDPWPKAAAQRTIAHDGPVMASAVERYRTGRVIAPVGNSPSGMYQSSQGGASGGAAGSQPTAPPTTPVK